MPTPVFTVTRGRPTPAELAAVVAVLLAAGTAAATPAPVQAALPSRWSAGFRTRGALPPPGPGSWRASAVPR